MKQQIDYAALERKNKRLILSVFGVVALMVGLAYVSVPLYTLFCQLTGFDGTTQRAETAPTTILDRQVTIRFNADVNSALDWSFKPEVNKMDIRVGQSALTSFKAHNNSTKAVTGTALYNVTPPKAGKYFNKMQCFCFGEQVLQPGETMDMPVLFYMDPEMDKDPNMDDVTTVTLSYTFYKADSDALDSAAAEF